MRTQSSIACSSILLIYCLFSFEDCLYDLANLIHLILINVYQILCQLNALIFRWSHPNKGITHLTNILAFRLMH